MSPLKIYFLTIFSISTANEVAREGVKTKYRNEFAQEKEIFICPVDEHENVLLSEMHIQRFLIKHQLPMNWVEPVKHLMNTSYVLSWSEDENQVLHSYCVPWLELFCFEAIHCSLWDTGEVPELKEGLTDDVCAIVQKGINQVQKTSLCEREQEFDQLGEGLTQYYTSLVTHHKWLHELASNPMLIQDKQFDAADTKMLIHFYILDFLKENNLDRIPGMRHIPDEAITTHFTAWQWLQENKDFLIKKIQSYSQIAAVAQI